MDRLGGDVTPAEARTFGGLHGYLESRTSLFCSSRVCRVFNPCYTKPRVLHAPPGTFAQLSKQPNFNANTMYVVGAPLLDSGELVPPENRGKRTKRNRIKAHQRKRNRQKIQWASRVSYLHEQLAAEWLASCPVQQRNSARRRRHVPPRCRRPWCSGSVRRGLGAGNTRSWVWHFFS